MNNNNRLSLLKKDSTVPGALLLAPLPGVGFLLLLVLAALPRHLVQQWWWLIILAWCHSFFEFNSSPSWLEIKVPSSTSLVNGFL